MIESITDNKIFRSVDCFEETSIGIETAWKQNCIFSVVIIGDNLLQIFMNVLGTADKSDWAHAKTMGIKGIFCGLDESGMIGKPEIIVSAKI